MGYIYNLPNGVLTYMAVQDENFKNYIRITKARDIHGDVVIPSSIDGLPVREIDSQAFANQEKITSVTIPDTVIKIKDRAFYACSALQKIKLPENLSFLGYSAFVNCRNLKSIDIPGTIHYIDDYTFEFCCDLKEIIFHEGLEEIGDSAFYGCSIENLNLPDSLTVVGMYAFAYNTKITNIKFNESLTDIKSGAFSKNENLKSVVFNDGLKIVDSDAFWGCKNLKEIILPDSLATLDVSALDGCASLKKIYIGKNTELENTYKGFATSCTGLENISVSKDNKFYTAKDGILYSKNKEKLIRVCPQCPHKSITIPKSVTKISKDAFNSVKDKIIRFDSMSISGIEASSLHSKNNIYVRCHNGSDIEKYCVKKSVNHSPICKLNMFLSDIAENENRDNIPEV